jgi:hypothetical protein
VKDKQKEKHCFILFFFFVIIVVRAFFLSFNIKNNLRRIAIQTKKECFLINKLYTCSYFVQFLFFRIEDKDGEEKEKDTRWIYHRL